MSENAEYCDVCAVELVPYCLACHEAEEAVRQGLDAIANRTMSDLTAQLKASTECLAALTAERDALKAEVAELVAACEAASELSRLQALVDACEDPQTIEEAIAWIDHANGLLSAALARHKEGTK